MIEQKYFRLSDIFEIKNLKSIDKNKLKQEIGNIPYVSQTKLNNGILGYVCDHGITKLNFGNCISIGTDTQVVRYQENNFYSSEKIIGIRNNYLNKYIGYFIFPILEQILQKKFSYGHKASMQRISEVEIKLPSTPNRNPDWEFMESYIREQYREVVQERINELEKRKPDAPTVPRDIEEIQAIADFTLGQIFDVKMSKSINNNKLNSTPGNIPYITRTGLNNGILKFVCEQGTEKLNPGNVITIGVDTQTVFYQKQAFYCGNNILSLSSENVDQYIGVFIVGILDQIVKKKYNYGYGATLTRIKNLEIPLPITSDGKPDWEFMSDYIKTQSQIVFEEELKRLKSKLDE